MEAGAWGGLQLGHLAGEGAPLEAKASGPAARGVHDHWEGAKDVAVVVTPCSDSACLYAGTAAPPAIAGCTNGGAHDPIGRKSRAGGSNELRYMLGWFSLVAPALGLPMPLALWTG